MHLDKLDNRISQRPVIATRRRGGGTNSVDAYGDRTYRKIDRQGRPDVEIRLPIVDAFRTLEIGRAARFSRGYPTVRQCVRRIANGHPSDVCDASFLEPILECIRGLDKTVPGYASRGCGTEAGSSPPQRLLRRLGPLSVGPDVSVSKAPVPEVLVR
jgi:hypothetical protein